jgi:hypothetical protein
MKEQISWHNPLSNQIRILVQVQLPFHDRSKYVNGEEQDPVQICIRTKRKGKSPHVLENAPP